MELVPIPTLSDLLLLLTVPVLGVMALVTFLRNRRGKQ